MSGGRVTLGLGAGWYEQEHTAYGVPFPDVRERFDRLDRAARHRHRPVVDSRGRDVLATPASTTRCRTPPRCPSPSSPRSRSSWAAAAPAARRELAARYAAEFNTSFAPLEDFGPLTEGVRDACRAIERDPASLTYSAALVVCVGPTRPSSPGGPPPSGRSPTSCGPHGACGTADEAVAAIERWRSAGCERIYLQVLDLDDLEHLDLLAADVKPRVA